MNLIKSSFVSWLLMALVFLCTFHPSLVHAQSRQKTIEDMQVSWEFRGDHLHVSMKAPLQGWVALGFNEKNDIVHTDLVMVAVRDEKVESEEFYVVGMGNPQPVKSLGGEKWISRVKGKESKEGTSIEFDILCTPASHHYELKKGKEIWLICAYSVSDDLDHHSRKRRHVKVRL